MLTMILGGARSGKSRFAQSLCSGSQRVVYLATARVEAAEMRARVDLHRKERPQNWTTIEEPLAIAMAAEGNAPACDFILLDCLTLWLSNFFWEFRQRSPEGLQPEVFNEVNRPILAAAATHLIVVTNEVGCGIVPESPIGRHFRDLQDWVNQQVAGEADEVYQLVAGIPVFIKSSKGVNQRTNH
ncbi:MAG: bifunctional adenosylcobinamide kinase/adenosylcobinamide-phosphate guanylyltransferase [Acidobacteria bacterium]|nr:bifunctional adenosylcobinamide kinase/adenosylcobinamide-phosphate guanylyltransferase [Acidobacteriota bacterium]